MEIPGARFFKGLLGKKEASTPPNPETEVAPGNVVGDGMKLFGQSPDKQQTPLAKPKSPDMMAINQANEGVVRPNPTAEEGMYSAAAAGKPIAAEIFAADAGVSLPENLKTVAANQQEGLKPATPLLEKTA